MRSYAFFRQVANELLADYPDVEVDHVIVDAMTVHMIEHPERFDVVVCENIFGDILSDLGAAIMGGMGLAPSGQGCGTLGDPDEVISEEQAQQTLQVAWDGGLRYFDTAPWYGTTRSEHQVGHFLRQRPRDEFVITTKVGRVYSRPEEPESINQSPWMKRWRGGLPFDLHFDYTADGILRSYEDSLMRLGLNRVDALAIHDLDLKHHENSANVQKALARNSQRGWCIEALNMRKFFCDKGLSIMRGIPDADRV